MRLCLINLVVHAIDVGDEIPGAWVFCLDKTHAKIKTFRFYFYSNIWIY